MLAHRRGSVLAYAITLTSLFLTMIVGTMAYFESSNKQATGEKWRSVAEQAARSGLDYVIGWGETSIDKTNRLPSSWEMNDGQTMDPVYQYALTLGGAPAYKASTSALSANPEGELLGSKLGEYVMGRVGNYVVTFKARIQQFRFSNDAPRQYRIGVIGRVRKITGTPLDNNEGSDIVSERLLVATIGKEPFSRYAALIDIDAVKNWVPGEEVQGPVHINRGYLDSPSGRNLQRTNQTFKDERSFMRLYNVNPAKGWKAVSGKMPYPVFKDRVTMTVYSDGNTGIESDDVPQGQTKDDGVAYLSVDDNPVGSDATGMLSNAFQAAENRTSWNGGPGPMLVPSPIPLPANSRHRINNALGLPADKAIATFKPWLDNAEDGVYIPTMNFVTNDPGTGATFVYGNAGNNYPSGGIYIRGNVEVMRMTVNGPYSYYLFQLGYGPYSYHRCYFIRARRTLPHTLEMRAFPAGNTAASAMRGILGAGNVSAAQLDNYFAGLPQTTTPTSYAVNAGTNNYTKFAPVPTDYNTHPFNGIIMVDCSKYDTFRFMTDAQQKTSHPISGNIYALGDPGLPPNQAQNKQQICGSTYERVSTNDNIDPAAASDSSRLTIVTAGHIFIQNHILLESLLQAPGNLWKDPIGDSISIALSRDLIGLVADRQVLFGLAAPDSGGARQNAGCVVHAAIAALGDPDTLPNGRKGIRAAWGSVTVEGLQTVFGLDKEIYDCVNLTGNVHAWGILPDPSGGSQWANYTDAAGATHRVFKVAYSTSPWNAPPAGGAMFLGDTADRNMPGNPLMILYTGINRTSNNPNSNTRGRLLVFGSVTQKKRGAVGAGNQGYDKDFRYDKRLMSIAPPIFPSNTSISMRVSMMDGASIVPRRGATLTPNADLNFLATDADKIAKPI